MFDTPFIIHGFIWLAVIAGLSFLGNKGPNRRLIFWCFIITGFCCWLSFICAYLHQLHPLVGPHVDAQTYFMIHRNWGVITDLPPKPEE